MGTSSRERDPLLEVTNFGPIVEAAVDLRPLTVLVGPSNTGKSYLAILIYALATILRRRASGCRAAGEKITAAWLRLYRAIRKVPPLAPEVRESMVRWARDIHEGRTTPESRKHVDTTLSELFAAWIRKPLATGIREFGDIMDDEITRCFGVDRSQDLIRRANARGEPRGAGTRIVLSRYVSEASGRHRPFKYEFHDSRAEVFPHLVHSTREPAADRRGRSAHLVLRDASPAPVCGRAR